MSRRRTRLAACVVLSVPLVVSFVALANGDAGDAGAPRGDGRASLAGKYAEACARGNAKMATHDTNEAIVWYRRAIDLDPADPLAHYLLGAAELSAGNIVEAEAAWNEASLDSNERDPSLRARILFVVADLKERQWKWVEAKTAWQAYLDWASRFPDAGAFPESARSRLQAIDTMLRQDKDYEIVRRRIAETKDGGVSNDSSTGADGG